MNFTISRLVVVTITLSFLSGCVLESSSPVSQALAATSAKKASVEAKAPSLKTNTLGDGFFTITGAGGNIGVLTGPDGIFVIDDKFEENGLDIISSLGAISNSPIKFVVNTHYHGDHSGANAMMKSTGALIIAHKNVRTRMGMNFENRIFGRTVKAVDPSLWPDMTFSDQADFYMNGQTIHLIHTVKGHTDGDTIVHFKEGNIIHMGDNFFNGLFPYVDVDSGGTLQGMIDAQTQAIALSDIETKIIPGHGPLATKADLIKSRDMLSDIQERVRTQVETGRSLDEMIVSNLLADYKNYASFIDEANMIRIAYYSLGGQ